MADMNKFFVFFTIYLNLFLCIADRACQIYYYVTTNFSNETIKGTCLSFILIKPGANVVMMILYLIALNDIGIGVRTKIKYFFLYVLSAEFCYSIGVHQSFKSKFSQYADNVIVTKKVINMMHIMFISMPQILIITVHSSSKGFFLPIDIANLCTSCLFITWSLIYYVLCNFKESEYEAELEMIVN